MCYNDQFQFWFQRAPRKADLFANTAGHVTPQELVSTPSSATCVLHSLADNTWWRDNKGPQECGAPFLGAPNNKLLNNNDREHVLSKQNSRGSSKGTQTGHGWSPLVYSTTL